MLTGQTTDIGSRLDFQVLHWTFSKKDGSRSLGPSTTYSPDLSHHGSNVENHSPRKSTKLGSVNYAAQRLKRLLHWPKMKTRASERLKKLEDRTSASASEGVPVPLRQRFSKPSSLPNNKRALSVRSNLPSPTAKKKLASGVMHGVMQAVPNFTVPHRSRSSSFSKLSLSSQSSVDTPKGGQLENDTAKPSCSYTINDDGSRNSLHRPSLVNKMLVHQYLCFGGSSQHLEAPTGDPQPYDIYERSVLSAA
ncbi:UNVERIFIED_CONTAM: hypothetical protein Scaly_2090400 [Sesamum calycinum]|uniref:Uncharacterized protein n=2 Tax=Sesamum TaxID=4181 RepID=A0AAW2MK55_9LAMI